MFKQYSRHIFFNSWMLLALDADFCLFAPKRLLLFIAKKFHFACKKIHEEAAEEQK